MRNPALILGAIALLWPAVSTAQGERKVIRIVQPPGSISVQNFDILGLRLGSTMQDVYKLIRSNPEFKAPQGYLGGRYISGNGRDPCWDNYSTEYNEGSYEYIINSDRNNTDKTFITISFYRKGGDQNNKCIVYKVDYNDNSPFDLSRDASAFHDKLVTRYGREAIHEDGIGSRTWRWCAKADADHCKNGVASLTAAMGENVGSFTRITLDDSHRIDVARRENQLRTIPPPEHHF